MVQPRAARKLGVAGRDWKAARARLDKHLASESFKDGALPGRLHSARRPDRQTGTCIATAVGRAGTEGISVCGGGCRPLAWRRGVLSNTGMSLQPIALSKLGLPITGRSCGQPSAAAQLQRYVAAKAG
jgi:hypothetical protein